MAGGSGVISQLVGMDVLRHYKIGFTDSKVNLGKITEKTRAPLGWQNIRSNAGNHQLLYPLSVH